MNRYNNRNKEDAAYSNRLKYPILIVVCGWPLSGKDTIARLLQKSLGNIQWRDMDDIRGLLSGLPEPYPEQSPELLNRDRETADMAYRQLFKYIDYKLWVNHSVIATLTLTRESTRKGLLAVYEKHPKANLKIVRCAPKNDSREEIEKRLASRKFGVNYFGSTNSYERYLERKRSYEPMDNLPHIEIDTSPPHTPDESAEEALRYILS